MMYILSANQQCSSSVTDVNYLYFSGYTDGRVSVTATQYSLKNSGCSKDSMVLLVPPW